MYLSGRPISLKDLLRVWRRMGKGGRILSSPLPPLMCFLPSHVLSLPPVLLPLSATAPTPTPCLPLPFSCFLLLPLPRPPVIYGPPCPRQEMDDVTANLLRPRKKNRAIIVWWRRSDFLGLGHLLEDGPGSRKWRRRVSKEGHRVFGDGGCSVIRLMVAFPRLTLQETFYKSGRFRN